MTFGSTLFQDNIADQDDYVVAALRAAGIVITGKTATPEFGLPCYTETRIGPPARTPWDLSQVGRGLQRRRGGGGRGRAGARRAGQRRRGIDPDPVERLRAVRHQAHPGPDLRRAADPRPGRPVHQRADRANRRGCRAAARRDGRQPPGRHVHAARAARRARRSWPTPGREPGRLRIGRSLRNVVEGATSTRTAWPPTTRPARCWPSWATRSRTSACRSGPTRSRCSRRSGTRWPR